MSDHSPSNQLILPADQVGQWEADARALDVQISDLTARRDELLKRVEAARFLFSDALAPIRKEMDRRPSMTEAWERQIEKIVKEYPQGCPYPDLRAALLASPLGDALRRSSKTYERAMRNLALRGVIERGYGRVFTPSAFADFKAGAKSHEAHISTQPFTRSPMGEAVLRIVHARPGLMNKGIIAKLREDREFNATLSPNATQAYNVIARLTRRQNIVKRDDGANLPGPQFPYKLLGLAPHEDRVPNGKAAGTLFAEGVAAPSTDNRRGFRIVG